MSQLPADWSDLTRLWQAEGAAISVDELEAHTRRERRMMRLLAALELAGLGLGVALGAWLGMFSPHVWLFGVFTSLCAVMAWVAWRSRAEAGPLGGDDLLTSLRVSIAREDWNAERLRFGRALSFMVLFIIAFMGSYLLRRYALVSATALIALAASTAWACAVLTWNLRLVRRSRARRRRLESYLRLLEE